MIGLANKKFYTAEDKYKQVTSLLKGITTILVNTNTGESNAFVSGREAAKFIGINQSALTKYIRKQKFYLGRGFWFINLLKIKR